MASDALLITVAPNTPQSIAMASLQRRIKQAITNAGIALPT